MFYHQAAVSKHIEVSRSGQLIDFRTLSRTIYQQMSIKIKMSYLLYVDLHFMKGYIVTAPNA